MISGVWRSHKLMLVVLIAHVEPRTVGRGALGNARQARNGGGPLDAIGEGQEIASSRAKRVVVGRCGRWAGSKTQIGVRLQGEGAVPSLAPETSA